MTVEQRDLARKFFKELKRRDVSNKETLEMSRKLGAKNLNHFMNMLLKVEREDVVALQKLWN